MFPKYTADTRAFAVLGAAIGAMAVCIGASPIRADENGFASQAVLERIDALYGEMPPVQFQPAADRWQYLPNTMRKLQQGGTLRIVMLGDSIVNDTSHSQFEHLLMRTYPKCKIEKITSVRGSTGCWWYKEEGRVQQYVLDHRPDLVMIGGISNRGDVEAIRSVIRQIRAACDAEIMVMTGPFGRTDPVADSEWQPQFDPRGDSYRARLLRMAQEEKVEFFDIEAAWGRYIRECGKPLEWFKRDGVHANQYGFQVLGRILERYFAPK